MRLPALLKDFPQYWGYMSSPITTTSVIKFISSVNSLHSQCFREVFTHSRPARKSQLPTHNRNTYRGYGEKKCDFQSSDEINYMNNFHPLLLLFRVLYHTIQGDETHKQSTTVPRNVIGWCLYSLCESSGKSEKCLYTILKLFICECDLFFSKGYWSAWDLMTIQSSVFTLRISNRSILEGVAKNTS